MPKRSTAQGALFVRLPAAAVDKLDRAAEASGMRKKDIVANLVTKYVDPSRGSYSFRPYDPPLQPPEVMNAEQAAQLLQVEEAVVLELAEAGKLPGRKLGAAWRFSRAALVEWLSKPEKR
jgi:excisionase family DNA binding protein